MIDTDRDGRAVGVVTVGDLVLNKHLLEYGYAWLYDRYCKKPFCFAWAKAEHDAKKAKHRPSLCQDVSSREPWVSRAAQAEDRIWPLRYGVRKAFRKTQKVQYTEGDLQYIALFGTFTRRARNTYFLNRQIVIKISTGY